MITKIKRLKNIGKFYDFSARAQVLDWHKNTFVFAPNAYGKTTLVNVLRSLRDNDPKLILARKTLGAATKPEAVIVIDSANQVFNGIRWERQYPAIQIFDAPCFKNTLSEGDKSTLAFAFFIAVLEKAPQLDKQIVVFDDPLSSLDETRREATARLLLALSPIVNQLNVFTHKRDFLYMLCDKMPENNVLQIRSDKKNGSRIELFNVEEERKSEHARLVEEMERYIVEDFGPTADTMQGNLRKVFEVVLKTKYYRILATDIKAKHGFATLLGKLFNAGLLDISLKPRLFDLCSVANGAHHGEIVDATPKRLSRDELIPLIRETLDLVHKV